MTALELNTQKVELAKQILEERNEDVLKKVMAYFKKVKKTTLKLPCQMTLEELKTEITQAKKDYEQGNYITNDSMRKKHLR